MQFFFDGPSAVPLLFAALERVLPTVLSALLDFALSDVPRLFIAWGLYFECEERQGECRRVLVNQPAGHVVGVVAHCRRARG